MKTTLIITGQLRLQENQTPTEKINYHIQNLKPDNTVLFLWENEYQKYKQELDSLKLQIITENQNLPIVTEQQLLNCHKHINQQPNTLTPLIYNQANKIFYSNLIKSYFIIQQAFKNNKSQTDLYIKTRYDLHYQSNFNINPLFQFINENKPIITTPFGGDMFAIGLGDLLTITNNKANEIFKTYYDNFIKMLDEDKIPLNAEMLIRYVFKNLNHADIYRINFHCTTQHMLSNNHFYHGLKQYGEMIGKDNLYLPNYKIV